MRITYKKHCFQQTVFCTNSLISRFSAFVGLSRDLQICASFEEAIRKYHILHNQYTVSMCWSLWNVNPKYISCSGMMPCSSAHFWWGEKNRQREICQFNQTLVRNGRQGFQPKKNLEKFQTNTYGQNPYRKEKDEMSLSLHKRL